MTDMPIRKGTSIAGDRFEAAVSPDRELVDIVDRKELKRLILLDLAGLRELRDLTNELIEFME